MCIDEAGGEQHTLEMSDLIRPVFECFGFGSDKYYAPISNAEPVLPKHDPCRFYRNEPRR